MPEVVITSYGLRKKITVEITGGNSNIWVLEMGNVVPEPAPPVEPAIPEPLWEVAFSQGFRAEQPIRIPEGVSIRQ
jgi:hypothetical protein